MRTKKLLNAVRTALLALGLMTTMGVSGCFAPGAEAELGEADSQSLVGELTLGSAEGRVEPGEWIHYAPITVVTGSTLHLRLSGTGDADLVVRLDSEAEELGSEGAACAPEMAGSEESCAVRVRGAEQVYVSILGVGEEGTDFRLNAGRLASGSVPAESGQPIDVAERGAYE